MEEGLAGLQEASRPSRRGRRRLEMRDLGRTARMQLGESLRCVAQGRQARELNKGDAAFRRSCHGVALGPG